MARPCAQFDPASCTFLSCRCVCAELQDILELHNTDGSREFMTHRAPDPAIAAQGPTSGELHFQPPPHNAPKKLRSQPVCRRAETALILADCDLFQTGHQQPYIHASAEPIIWPLCYRFSPRPFFTPSSPSPASHAYSLPSRPPLPYLPISSNPPPPPPCHTSLAQPSSRAGGDTEQTRFPQCSQPCRVAFARLIGSKTGFVSMAAQRANLKCQCRLAE